MADGDGDTDWQIEGWTVNSSLLEVLRCPEGCAVPLELSIREGEKDQIQAGLLCCPTCSRTYPVENGIARMLPSALTDADHALSDDSTVRKRSEMRARDEQALDYDRMWHLNLFGLLEIPMTLRQLALAPDHLLLEAGCGTGRMTRQFAARCRQVVAVDFSWDSLHSCAAKLQKAGVRNVDLIQADICRLPLQSAIFDRIVSCQVLEHIPTPAAREQAIEELGRVMRPGGNLVLSAYQYSWITRLFTQKEGEHTGGIYFYRFARDELQALLSRSLTVEAISGALIYHYTARCRKGEV
ncbi:MAG TPA: methyltransferase domain-containing protein [Chthonomonadales bacterium]|nr:methyltransferase domain-containing protein [Chthonomonadales bacterium]